MTRKISWEEPFEPLHKAIAVLALIAVIAIAWMLHEQSKMMAAAKQWTPPVIRIDQTILDIWTEYPDVHTNEPTPDCLQASASGILNENWSHCD